MRMGQRVGPVAVALALLVSSAGAAAAGEGIGLPLRRVDFQSDGWIDAAGLRRLLPLTLGEPVTAEQLEASKHVLELAEVFRSIDVETRDEAGGALVTFHLKRRRILTDVTVRGYDFLSWRDVNRRLRLRSGSFYSPQAIEAARQRLLTRYAQTGHPRAEVDVEIRKHAGEVTARFTIREGTPTLVTAVGVAGEIGLPPGALEPLFRALVGKPYGRDTARTGERLVLAALRDAGYYEADIDHAWLPDGETGGTLQFTVKRGPLSIIEITGNESKTAEQLLGLMDLRTRLIVTDGTWRELARRIRRFYHESGYYRAKVKLQIDDGDPRRIVFAVDEGRPYAVRRVELVGNHQMRATRLRDEMNTQPRRLLPWPRSGAFVRAVFDEDLRRLWFFYREQGFATAEIVDAPVTVDDATGAIAVTVVIDEGPRTIVEAVQPPDLSGLPPQPVALQLAPGEPLRPAVLDADAQSIRAALRRDGYIDATVTPLVTRRSAGDSAPAVVEWTIVRGERRTVGSVIVQGNVETYDDIVRRQLPFKTGDALDTEALQRGQDNIYQLGTYRSVAVRPLDATASAPDVGVEVVPRPPGSVQWGAGYNTRDGFTGTGELGYDNLGRRARRLRIRGQGSVVPTDPSSSQFLALIGYREPRFLDSPWAWNVELIGERSTKTINQYDVLSGNLANGFSRVLVPRLRVALDLQLERDDVFNVKPASFRPEDSGIFYTTALAPSLLYDGRNDPFAPTRGVFESASLRYAPPGVSTVQFGAINLQHSQAFPLASWLSFISSARVAYGRAFSGDSVLPIRERYFLGGSTSVRGYAENSLGPTDLNGNVLGGDLAMVLSLELRVPIIYQLSAAVFNDNGALFLTQCDDACQAQRGVLDNAITLENFRHSAGPGLRYMTPVGPISLDFGFKIDRRSGESLGEVHFSISGTF